MLYEILILIAAGLACGAFTKLFGWGGGLTIVPALLIYFPLKGLGIEASIHYALGTSFLIMLINNIISTFHSSKNKDTIWQVVFLLVPLTVIGVFVGGYLVNIMPPQLNIMVLIFVAGYALFAFIKKLKHHKANAEAKLEINVNKPKFVIISSFVGVLSAVSGGGSSLMLSPMLKKAGLSMKQMIAIITAMNAVLAIAGFVTFLTMMVSPGDHIAYSFGYVDFGIASVLLVISLLGLRIGAYVTKKISEQQYMSLYIFSLIFIICILVFKLF